MVIAGLVIIFAILAAIILISNGNNKPAVQEESQTTSGFYVKEPTAIDVENVSNSISDDISNLNTDQDFPKDNLSDENLRL